MKPALALTLVLLAVSAFFLAQKQYMFLYFIRQ